MDIGGVSERDYGLKLEEYVGKDYVPSTYYNQLLGI